MSGGGTAGAGAASPVAPRPEVRPKARSAIHERLIAWFAEQPRGRVLDAPAGFGHLSLHLRELGYDVVCGEIQPEIFAVPGLHCIHTDLNRRIEAEDASFDYTTCVDGLEHMTDPYTAVAEFARVLRPGGLGVFTVPNYSNFEKRVGFLLRGYLTRPASLERWERHGRRLHDFHNTPLTITLLEFMFRINALRIEAILQDAPKRKQRFYLPAVALLRLVARLSSERSRQKSRSDLTLRSEVVLGGNTLIFITRKEGPQAADAG